MFRTAGLAMLTRPQAIARPILFAAPAVVSQMRFASIKPEGYPKGPQTAYFLFMGENRAKIAAKNPDLSIGEIGKKMGEVYQALSAKEKERFTSLAVKDKKRYEAEMAKYIAKGGVKLARASKNGKVKDPNMPKRGLSAFFIFSNEKRPEVIKEVGNNIGLIGKRMGELWAAASAKEKARCEALAAKDKLRYITELKAGGCPVSA